MQGQAKVGLYLKPTEVDRVFTRHDRCSSWSAHWGHIVIVQYDSRIGHFIDVWSWDLT